MREEMQAEEPAGCAEFLAAVIDVLIALAGVVGNLWYLALMAFGIYLVLTGWQAESLERMAVGGLFLLVSEVGSAGTGIYLELRKMREGKK